MNYLMTVVRDLQRRSAGGMSRGEFVGATLKSHNWLGLGSANFVGRILRDCRTFGYELEEYY